jgi:hypothetical protein
MNAAIAGPLDTRAPTLLSDSLRPTCLSLLAPGITARGTSSRPMHPSYTSCAEHFRSQQSRLLDESLPEAAEVSGHAAVAGESPFLRLPTEIRLQIYQLLVLPHEHNDLLPSYMKLTASATDFFDYDKMVPGTNLLASSNVHSPTLRFRTIDPLRHDERLGKVEDQQLRSTYSVHCDRFRARCLATTYHCVNSASLSQSVGLLCANKQIHEEVAELIYSHYTFDFDNHVEAIVPFLQDLTPFSRSCIKSIRFVKRSLAYEKEYDKCEWANAMQCLSSPETGLGLQTLDLGIVSGRPGPNGWDTVPPYSAQEFGWLKEMDGMEWLRDVLEIKGLQALNVNAIVEHCPPASNSRAMAGYIRFSASITGGLSEFLKHEMLV